MTPVRVVSPLAHRPGSVPLGGTLHSTTLRGRVALLCALCAPLATNAQILSIDQSHTQTPNIAFSVRIGGPIGQTFTPTLNRLNFVDVRMRDLERTFGGVESQGATFQMIIRDGTMLTGTELGRSEPLFLPSAFGRIPAFEGPVVRFKFANTIAVVPGEFHLFELIQLSGDPDGYFFVYGNFPSNYVRGEGIDRPYANFDYWFQEGLVVDIPAFVPVPTLEPGLLALLVLLLAGGAAATLRLRARRS